MPVAFLVVAPLFVTAATPELAWESAPWGRYALAAMQAAPFPSASRAQGYRQGPINFPADPHYVDNRVPVLVPHSVPPVGAVDFVVYLHGHMTNMERRYYEGWPQKLAAEADLPAVFLFPQGPKMATDSDYGKLCEPGGLVRLLSEALEMLTREQVVGDATVGRVVLVGHSGAYYGMGRILSDPEQRKIVDEVDLLDASYGEYEGLVAAASEPGIVFRSVFSSTLAANNVEMMGRLEAAGCAFHVLREADLTDERLSSEREPLFIHSQAAHDQLPELYFARLLRTGFQLSRRER